MSLNLFIITKNKRSFSEINKVIAEIDGVSVCGQYIEESETKLSQLLKMVKPELIIVDDTLSDVSVASLVTKLIGTYQECGIIGLYSSHKDVFTFDSSFEGRLIKIPKPIEVERLRYAVNLIIHNIMKSYIGKKLPELKKGREYCNKFLSFFAPKDGEGKTTIIVNLAHMLSQKYGQKVLLLNLNPIFDDTDVYLNFKSKQSVDQIVNKFITPSANLDMLYYGIEEHPVYKNLFVISGCDLPAQLKESADNRGFFELFLWYIESKFDWILVDTSSALDRTTFSILNISKNPLIVLQNHTISIRNIEIFLEIMKSCKMDIGKFRFIATRISKTVGLKPEKLKSIFGGEEKFFSFIPSRGMLGIDSIVKKRPMVEICDKEDTFYKVFDAMAHNLVEHDQVGYATGGKEQDDTHHNLLIDGIKQFFKLKK
ncbi:AAA family ATPase [bacterium]|nr:AAA family ATPase [bacterium]